MSDTSNCPKQSLSIYIYIILKKILHMQRVNKKLIAHLSDKLRERVLFKMESEKIAPNCSLLFALGCYIFTVEYFLTYYRLRASSHRASVKPNRVNTSWPIDSKASPRFQAIHHPQSKSDTPNCLQIQ